MIAAQEIITALETLEAKLPAFNPDDEVGGGLPVTMGDLVMGDFDRVEMWESRPPAERSELRWNSLRAPGRMTSRIPLDLSALEQKTPAPRRYPDFRDSYTICSAFWAYCVKHEIEVEIDHPLTQKDWPLMKRFETETKAQTGLEAGVLFGWWDDNFEEERYRWTEAYMPLYDAEQGHEEVPLLEFLTSILWFLREDARDYPSLPEAAFEEGRGEQDAKEAGIVLGNILRSGRLRLLDKTWRTAIGTLKKYKGDILCYWDPQEASVPIVAGTAQSIEILFDCARDVRKMLEGVNPLVIACLRGDDFWDRFIKGMKKIATRYPELKEERRHEQKTLLSILT